MCKTLAYYEICPFSVNYESVMFYDTGPWGIYHKTIRIRNLHQNARFHSKKMSFILSVTNALAWTSKLAYYGICILWIRSIFIVQALGPTVIKHLMFIIGKREFVHGRLLLSSLMFEGEAKWLGKWSKWNRGGQIWSQLSLSIVGLLRCGITSSNGISSTIELMLPQGTSLVWLYGINSLGARSLKF